MTTKPKAIICDLDGTLCNHAHRLHFVDPIAANCMRLCEPADIDKPSKSWWAHCEDINKPWKPDYESFYAAMDKDTVNEWCLDIVERSRMEGYSDGFLYVLFVTGRPEKHRKITEEWLDKKVINWGGRLFMRSDCLPFSAPDKLGALSCEEINSPILNWKPDHRPSYIIKREIYERDIKDKYDVLFVLEDDEDCAQMYKELGLTVLKVLT